MSARVLFVMGDWPNPSETFLAREMLQLARLGLDFEILALRRRSAVTPEDAFAELDGRVTTLPGRTSGTALMAELRAITKYPAKYFRIAGPCKWSFGPGLVFRLDSVLAAAQELSGKGFTRVHGQFASMPGEVAWVLARWLDLPFSFSGHARDLFVPRWGLRRLVRDARFVVTCTEHNREHLAQRFPDAKDRIHRIYHGIDTPPTAPPRNPAAPPLILAVGRLVEKKGFTDLVAACALLSRQNVSYRCEIVGDGPLRPELQRFIRGEQIPVTLTGWCTQQAVREKMLSAACLVAPSVIADDGDRDGIPNVLLEAMSLGTPVVAASVSGIPEVVQNDHTGFLVNPGDPPGLARTLARVLANPSQSEAQAVQARKLVIETFDPEANARRLNQLLTGTL